MDEAITENAVGIEVANIVIDADAAGVGDEAGDNDITSQGVAYSCMAENCDFKTPICSQEDVACQLLVMHTNLKHKNKEDAGRSKLGHKIWLPEELSLDPAEDNGEHFTFWLQKFKAYLIECNIVAAEEKFMKLKSRLSYSVYQHILDSED